jgi:hypothetical protein
MKSGLSTAKSGLAGKGSTGMDSTGRQNLRMAFDPEQRRSALRSFLKDHEKLNPGLWETTAGLGEGTLRKFLKGRTETLTDKTYERLADAASHVIGRSVLPQELQGGEGGVVFFPQKKDAGATSGWERVVDSRVNSVTPLLVWKLAHSSSGQQGAFVLSSEAIVDLPRAELAVEAKKTFRCKLLDNANAPGYAAGHTIDVSPDVAAHINDLCIFTDETKVFAEGAPSIAAILRGITATHWITTQNSVPGEQSLSRETYPQAWPVTAHYPHGV